MGAIIHPIESKPRAAPPPLQSTAQKPAGAFSVDVEEWFHAHNLRIQEQDWPECPSRVERSIDVILNLLDDHATKGTFFILGWVAQRNPGLVRRIHELGHEIASHGFMHRSIHGQSRREFREDITRAKSLLEDQIGARVRGFRAPSYSITPATAWALDEIESAGYQFDSSIVPTNIPGLRYGWNGAPRRPHPVRPALWEFPLPTLNVGGLRIPALAGAYLRLWPAWISRRCLRSLASDGLPVVLNVHPWELDVDQPRCRLGALRGLRHYANLSQTKQRLDELLRLGAFGTLTSLFKREVTVHSRRRAGLVPRSLFPSKIATPATPDRHPSPPLAGDAVKSR